MRLLGSILGFLGAVLTAESAQWTTNTSLPARYSEHCMVYSSGFLYHTGGFTYTGGSDDGTNVFYAQVHSNGTIGTWSATAPLPEPVYDHTMIASKGFLYVLGGNHSTLATGDQVSDVVYYSKLNPDGSVGVWQTANPLPYRVAFSGAAVWNNRIYVTAGYSQFGVTNAVYSAEIQADGSLGAWVPQIPLPAPAFTHASVANGVLYVIGGFNDGGAALVKKVYYSKINVGGTLAGWNQTTLLPQEVGEVEAVAANGRIFIIGGSNGQAPLHNVYSAAVNGDGSLGLWSVETQLPTPLYFHASAVSDSHIFVSGGSNPDLIQNAVYSMPLPPPPASPALTPQGIGTNGNFQLQLASDTNTGFGLLASTNLTNWTRLGWGFTGTNGLLSFQDTNAASFPRRYYRATWPLP